jgi:hypothetical protein
MGRGSGGLNLTMAGGQMKSILTDRERSHWNALRAIAGMKIDDKTNHKELSALAITIARTELERWWGQGAADD